MTQVNKEMFAKALSELGHDPQQFAGKRLSLNGFCELYELHEDHVLDAIENRHIAAHYDFRNDTIWIDALDAAHYFYCLKSQAHAFR